MADLDSVGPPAGCYPLGMTEEQMQRYGLKTGDDYYDTVDMKLFGKQECIDEYTRIGFYSAFHDFRDKIPVRSRQPLALGRAVAGGELTRACAQAYPEDQILVVADKEERYGNNWLIALTVEAKDMLLEVGAIRGRLPGRVPHSPRARAQSFNKLRREEEERRRAEEDEERQHREEEEALANMVYEDRPVEARPYESATAEDTEGEVNDLTLRPRRALVRAPPAAARDAPGPCAHSPSVQISMKLVRAFGEFGRPVAFNDRDAEQTGAGCAPGPSLRRRPPSDARALHPSPRARAAARRVRLPVPQGPRLRRAGPQGAGGVAAGLPRRVAPAARRRLPDHALPRTQLLDAVRGAQDGRGRAGGRARQRRHGGVHGGEGHRAQRVGRWARGTGVCGQGAWRARGSAVTGRGRSRGTGVCVVGAHGARGWVVTRHGRHAQNIRNAA